MKVTKVSPFTGKENTREINITPSELWAVEHRTKLIQEVVGHLNADDREFLMTGATAEDWDHV